ncbi:MAG TPA: hypothetical protein VLL76_05420 [Candidatus Omnitrophota bacterium]|nr:hypothetical protein [Candidatus Omnitrophota bacterium]
MDNIRRCAELSVGRGCAFALLAVFTFAVGLSWEPILAIRSSAILLTLTAVVLWHRAQFAHEVHYRRREVWLLMGRTHSLPEDRAHGVISNIMREVYLRWSRRFAAPALACWTVELAVRAVG